MTTTSPGRSVEDRAHRLGGPLQDALPGELTRVTLTWYGGDQYWEGPGPRPVTAGAAYALVLQCDGQRADQRAVVGLSDRANPDGRTGVDAFGVVPCDGRVRELAYQPTVDGRVELRPASSPVGAKVTAVVRRLAAGEQPADSVSTAGPAGRDAGAQLPRPGAVRNELTRLTDGSGPGSAQVERGLTYEISAACTAAGDLLTWELISSDQTDADGSKLSLASGTVPCDGRPRTERRTMAVTGQLTVHATAQPTDPASPAGPAGYWVTMSGPA